MRSKKTLVLAAIAILAAMVSAPAFAQEVTHSTPGIGGYDPVAYFTEGKPQRGSGYHVADYKGVTYAFVSKKHRKMFEANPAKYVPALNGDCVESTNNESLRPILAGVAFHDRRQAN